MRKLQLRDTFSVARLIKKANLKETLRDIIKDPSVKKIVDDEKNNKKNLDDKAEDIGINIIFSIIEKISDEGIEKDLYKLFASIFEITEKEVEEMSPLEFLNNLKILAKENDLRSFLSQATL
ncbi:hypothetical protein [uncultured Clostridium sp.]|uniref:hypothetical protein n=1 Tax=uncultured Clostridium sp. TaxID=59620 RepID=UPI0025FAAA2F|nr:hypothetical protein [uncultured Clostridium sp.]